MKCKRCGEVNPAEIHTCTPIDPLLEALRVPEKREWIGLTEEEVNDIVWSLPYEPSQEHIRAIEAKLKDKNT